MRCQCLPLYLNVFGFFSASDSASNADVSPTPSPYHAFNSATPGPHRAKAIPRRFSADALPDHVALELSFALKPPPCIVSLRKKVRGCKRKRRRPFDPIVVGSLMMKMEAQAVKTRPKRRPTGRPSGKNPGKGRLNLAGEMT